MSLAQQIIASMLLEGCNQEESGKSKKMFEEALALTIHEQLEDLKCALGEAVGCSDDEMISRGFIRHPVSGWMPVKRKFTVNGVTDSGDAYTHTQSAYSPRSIMRQHHQAGYTVHSITDDRGNDVTDEAKNYIRMNESVRTQEDDAIEQHLANHDINASANKGVVFVHSSDLDRARQLAADAGYSHHVMGGLNEGGRSQEDASLEQHLADHDINSSVSGGVARVHSSDLDKATSLVGDAGYSHRVVGGLNESTAVANVAAELLAQKRAEKAAEDQQRAIEASQAAAPVIPNDTTVLGNTVAVLDTPVAGQGV